MAEKRISELFVDLMKNQFLAFGAAALAVAYFNGCAVAGSLSRTTAYIGCSAAAILLSMSSIYFTGTEVSNRYPPGLVKLSFRTITCILDVAVGSALLVVLVPNLGHVIGIEERNSMLALFLDSADAIHCKP